MHHLKVYGLNPRVCIAGANPAEELIAMSNDRVMVTGFVNDLRPYIAASRMFVAPMMSGSGLQNKLLEAMALGLPVFTTELANSSLGASPGKEVIICQGPQEFAKKISMYVNEQDTLKQIALNGKEFVILNYQWEINNQILENALLELVGQN